MYRQKFDVKFQIVSNYPFEIKEEQLKKYIEYRLGLSHTPNIEFRLRDLQFLTETYEG